MNRINYNNKYNLDPKYIKCAGCPKPACLRHRDGSVIIPFKGKNGEEVCHKCAPCVKCGKESCGDSFTKHEKTNDNPSGEWALAYCSAECFNGTEKSSLPKREVEKTAKCDHCGKLSEFNKVGNVLWGKSFCSGNCYELAFTRAGSLKTRDEISAHCCVCSFRIFGQDGNFAENFKNRKDKKLHYSDRNFHARYCSETCFEKGGDKSGARFCCSYSSTQSDNSPKPNPAAPAPHLITSENNKNDNSIKVKNKISNETLTINLKSIKRLTLIDNNLVIEFNKTETNNNIQEVQILNDEQINNSQELQKAKSYLQESEEKSISQQKLNSILNSSTNSELTGKPDDKHTLAAGLSIGAVLIGLVIGLLVKKTKIKN